MTRAEQNSGTTAVRDGFDLDMSSLTGWMRTHVAGYDDDGSALLEQFKGGQSNPTYKLTARSGCYVVRSKPKGDLLASAHAVDREYRVLRALAPMGVPVPQALALCTDEKVIGRWFYVMAFTPGRVIWDLPSARWDPKERAAIWRAGADAAACLHRVDVREAGLAGFGKTGGYVARQMKRWREQYQYTKDGIENPAMDRLISWLDPRVPGSEGTTVVHGDLQLSNMIQREDGLGVAAIIDWELSTLGNPISDFAYYCRDYHMPVEAGGFGDDPGIFGIPGEAEMIARYEADTGLTVGSDWMFYVVFNMFRLAAIRQGVAKRLADGTATSPNAAATARAAVTIADQAWRIAQELQA